jgi:transcriptional regulator with XRE-family HTH domain
MSKSLSPEQVKAARALLGWTQKDLAKNAQVAISTVADFERHARLPMANNAKAIREALEGAGIQFVNDWLIKKVASDD